MNTEKRKIHWFPTLLILWNVIDIVVHVLPGLAEPWRIAGNIVGIVAALVVVFGVVKPYAWQILSGTAVAAVGSLGLSTTMSINMFERIREIGVLRAIGVSNVSIRGIVLLEEMLIGALSWIFGVILSYPTAVFISDAIGYSLLNMPLTFAYNVPGAIAWLFAILGLAIAASLGPARSAARLTIREVLAYE